MVQVVQTDLPPWVEVGVAFDLGDPLHQVGEGEVVGQAVQASEACQAFLEETFLVVGSQVAASYQVEAYLLTAISHDKNKNDIAKILVNGKRLRFKITSGLLQVLGLLNREHTVGNVRLGQQLESSLDTKRPFNTYM